jgi:Na+/proline symporter
MSGIDWIVLSLTLLGIIAYGLYKSRTSKDLDGYFLSNRSMPWYLVLLSIMGTQASAVTFLSAPGQAYTDGMCNTILAYLSPWLFYVSRLFHYLAGLRCTPRTNS